MRVYYDVSARIVDFGSVRFYEFVQEHIAEILTGSGLEITNGYTENLYHLYQRYATAYIIGSTAGSVDMFIEYLAEEYDEGDEDHFSLAIDTSAEMLRKAGFKLDARYKDSVADVMYNRSITHRVFPGCDGDESMHALAFELATKLFIAEHETIPEGGLLPLRIGLASVVSSVTPGTYLEHHGDDYKTLVVICEHENLL